MTLHVNVAVEVGDDKGCSVGAELGKSAGPRNGNKSKGSVSALADVTVEN